MRRWFLVWLLSGLAPAQAVELLVQLRPGAVAPAEVRRFPLGLAGLERWWVEGTLRQALERWGRHPAVIRIAPDVPRRPHRLPGEAALAPPDRFWFWQAAGLPAAWEITVGDPTVPLGLVDDAVEQTHPDLQVNLGPGYDPPPGSTAFPCPDLSRPRHGTQVAGVAAAEGDNGVGTAGAVWRISLRAATLGCRFSAGDAIAAYEWLASQGVKVINYSYGGPEFNAVEREALLDLQRQGVLLVASAGNDHSDLDQAPLYPAALGLANVISVGALDRQERPATWSNVGAFSVDLFAPGEAVYTTDLDGKYATVSGTSVAAPLVSGTLALLQSVAPQADWRALRAALLSGVRPFDPPLGLSRTGGRLDAAAALAALQDPRPLYLLREAVLVDDGDGDGLVDPHEEFTLNLVVENAGVVDGGALQVSLLPPPGAPLELRSSAVSVAPLAAQEEVLVSFQLRAGRFSTHRRWLLSVEFDDGRVRQRRHFPLHLGFLPADAEVAATIQGDAYDHVHAYHFHGEADWILELQADDPQRTRLVVGGEDVWVRFDPEREAAEVVASVAQAPAAPVARLILPAAVAGSGTYRGLVFRLPQDDGRDSAPDGYRLRLCRPWVGNAPPQVQAPAAVQARVGEVVRLRGSASDLDGQVRWTWWEGVSSGVEPLPSVLGNELRFTPERAGEYRFRFQASDDHCAVATREVVLYVEDPAPENDSERTFYRVPLGGTLNFVLPATERFSLISELPPGARFQDNRFQWDNAGPVGDYRLTFQGENGDQRIIRIQVAPRAQNNAAVDRGAVAWSSLVALGGMLARHKRYRRKKR